MAIVSLFYPSLYHPVSLLLFSSLTFQCIEELRCSTDGKEHNNTSLPAELPAPTAVRGEASRQRPPHGRHGPPHSTTHEGPGPPHPPRSCHSLMGTWGCTGLKATSLVTSARRGLTKSKCASAWDLLITTPCISVSL